MLPRYFGLDTHKDFVMAAAVNVEQQIVFSPQKIPMNELADWAAVHLTAQDEVVIEVTTNSWHIYDLLALYAGRVIVANPYKTKLIAEARIKTDKLDALVLAQLLAARFVSTVWVPERQIRQHRALASHRASLTQARTRSVNRLRSLLHRHASTCPHELFTHAGRAWLDALDLSPIEALERAHLLRQIDGLTHDLKQTSQVIAHLAAADARVPRLMQIAGIGCFTAFAILATIGNIQRFSSPAKLTAFAGLVPRRHQSGQRAFNGSITKAGSPILRWLMVEAARTAIRWDPHWQQVHQQIARRRGDSIAVVAVARKLLVVVWHLLIHQRPYYHLQPQTLVTKLQDWAYLIGRDALPTSSSAKFVHQHLIALGLEDLAFSLEKNKKGRLIVPAA